MKAPISAQDDHHLQAIRTILDGLNLNYPTLLPMEIDEATRATSSVVKTGSFEGFTYEILESNGVTFIELHDGDHVFTRALIKTPVI